ncbi:NtaA/DmoA family FMN-dependent monooxygenase [Allorhizobium undicola]|uniref:NtaA/DmoA family FMN-dependent monooxygenase n=1 Tax=Allorhizobium undicola TaxID=78527 RepID=UPI003D338C0A
MSHRKLHIGMSLAPTWLSGDGWRRQDSRVEDLLDSDFYVDVARRAEAAHLDFVFRPDTLFLSAAALENGPGFTSMDPTVLLAALSRETSHIGLLSTVSTSFFPPYIVARQIQSLNWLSKGRTGWNIVTALDGNDNFGIETMPSAEERYARAAEFTQIVRHLWQSFPADSIVCDRTGGRYADSRRVQPIDHRGPFFNVKGPLTLPGYDRAPLPLIQAGASPAGRDFAASVADAVFASAPDMQAAIDLRRDLRARAETHGRSADDILVLPGLSLYLAQTRRQAEELFAETHQRTARVKALANLKAMTGLEVTDWPDDRPVTLADLPPLPSQPRSRTHLDLLLRAIERDTPRLGELLKRPELIGSAHWQVIGTVDDAFDTITAWSEADAIDGFVTLPGGSVDCLHRSINELIPRLAQAGHFRKAYGSDTFYGHLKEK